MNRREFIYAGGTLAASAVLDAMAMPAGSRRLRLGVLSDIHLYEPANPGETFEHALRWFDAQKADAVMICGDLAEWGLTYQLKICADIWFKVFSENRRSDGGHVEKLFIYGDHDTGLNPKVLERLLPDSAKRTACSIPVNDRKRIWEETFHEPWAPIMIKDVKGYKFVLYHFTRGEEAGTGGYGSVGEREYADHAKGLPEFLDAHRAELSGERPFFYVQHRIPRGTAGGPHVWGQDDGYSTTTLSQWPNAVAFCGHGHIACMDEKSIWQGAFTAIEVPSLCYLQLQPGRENGFCLADEQWSDPKAHRPVRQMPMVDTGSEGRAYARQGLMVDVYDDRMSIERRDFVNDRDVGPNWVVPLPANGEKPFAHEYRRAHDRVPRFPDGATASVEKRMGENRAGTREDQFVVTFPAAHSSDDSPRAYDYEVTPVMMKGDVVRRLMSKRVYSSKCVLPESLDVDPVKCVFAASEIPVDRNPKGLRFVVRPMNAFGRAGERIETELI